MLTIQEFHADYLVGPDHPSPEGHRARMDGIIRQSLPRALEKAFADEAGLPWWCIRHLDVSLDIDPTWDDDRIAELWAALIVRQIGAKTEAGAGRVDPDVVVFADHAEYLGRFLLDTAQGKSWDQWFYQEFEGLRLLAASTAIRTACERDLEEGIRALATMLPRDREIVLSALTETEAVRLVQFWSRQTTGRISSPSDGSVSRNEFVRRLLSGWRNPQMALTETAEAIFHFLPGLTEVPEECRPVWFACAQALTRWRRILLKPDRASSSKLQEALVQGEKTALLHAARAEEAEVLIPLIGISRELLEEAGMDLGGPDQVSLNPEDNASPLIRYTPYGAAFLLFPILDDFPIERVSRDWPGAEDAAADVLLRALILNKCLGSGQSSLAWQDPLLRGLLRLPPALTLSQATAWQLDIPPSQCEALRQTVADWQRELGLVEDSESVITFLPETNRILLSAPPRGIWRMVCGADEQVFPQMDSLLPEGGIVRLSGEMTRAFFADKDPRWILPSLPEEPSMECEWIKRLPQIPDDMWFLQSVGEMSVAGEMENLLILASQTVLRIFSGKLPGFSQSSFDYLERNFLRGTASLEETPERRVVRMSRPPLALILHMAGLHRQTYRLAWLDDRPFELYPED